MLAIIYCRMLSALLLAASIDALVVVGLDVPHARISPTSRALDEAWPEQFPYSAKDLTPTSAGNDRLFYILPKFSQHAGEECRASIARFYECALPARDGDVLDLCSSFTSHYPEGWRGRRCVALGLNPLELDHSGVTPHKSGVPPLQVRGARPQPARARRQPEQDGVGRAGPQRVARAPL